MPLLCPIDNLRDNHELIICDSTLSKHAHKELFHYSDDVYVIADKAGNIFDAVSDITGSCNSGHLACPSRIHMALKWFNLLHVSLWQSKRPATGDVFMLLKNTGINSQELQPFKTAEINDIFPWLYYGKRFDILKRLCHKAKKQVEGHLKNHIIRVDCHLIAEDTKKVVASSL
jgi:hypothetical protein